MRSLARPVCVVIAIVATAANFIKYFVDGWVWVNTFALIAIGTMTLVSQLLVWQHVARRKLGQPAALPMLFKRAFTCYVLSFAFWIVYWLSVEHDWTLYGAAAYAHPLFHVLSALYAANCVVAVACVKARLLCATSKSQILFWPGPSSLGIPYVALRRQSMKISAISVRPAEVKFVV